MREIWNVSVRLHGIVHESARGTKWWRVLLLGALAMAGGPGLAAARSPHPATSTPSLAPSPSASPTPQPTPTVIGTPTPSGGTGAALTRLPIYCRLHKFPVTDKAAAYKRCNFMDEMIEHTCTARAGANASGNTRAQIGYYNSFAASD